MSILNIAYKTAEYFNLQGLGVIREGAHANVNLFRLKDLREQADFEHPWQPSLGMHEVMIAGKVTDQMRRLKIPLLALAFFLFAAGVAVRKTLAVLFTVKALLAENVDPESIRLFLSSAGRSLVRGVKKSAIAGFVKYFGKDAKQKFDDCLKNKEQEVTHYGNAIENRDSVAHKQGVQVTFSEIKQAVHAAEIILSAVTKALEIPSPPRPAGGRGH